MNLYQILEIEPNATKDDIKKAYKKKALEFHPDRHLYNKEYFENQFKLISQAYETLNDDEKRKQYDLNQTFSFNGDPISIFKKVFNIYNNIDKSTFYASSKIFLNKLLNLNIESFKNNDKNKTCFKFNLCNLKQKNIIYLPLQFFMQNNKLNIIIHHNSKDYIFDLFTESRVHNILFSNKKYTFKLEDLKDHTFKRINSFDLLKIIEIGVDDYFDGFDFKINIKPDIHINESICLKNSSSNIIQFKNKGLPIWSEKTKGDLYIYFKLIQKKRLFPYSTKSFLKINPIYTIFNEISIYD